MHDINNVKIDTKQNNSPEPTSVSYGGVCKDSSESRAVGTANISVSPDMMASPMLSPINAALDWETAQIKVDHHLPRDESMIALSAD
jgi:hypothetical protein